MTLRNARCNDKKKSRLNCYVTRIIIIIIIIIIFCTYPFWSWFFFIICICICTCSIGELGEAVESVRKQRILPSISYFSGATLVNQIYNFTFYQSECSV